MNVDVDGEGGVVVLTVLVVNGDVDGEGGVVIIAHIEVSSKKGPFNNFLLMIEPHNLVSAQKGIS